LAGSPYSRAFRPCQAPPKTAYSASNALLTASLTAPRGAVLSSGSGAAVSRMVTVRS